MIEGKKVKLHNRLFFKLYLSYACLLAVTALLIGIIFMQLYADVTMKNYHQQLLKQANAISRQLQQYSIDENYKAALNYVDSMEQLEDTNEIWVISNPFAKQPMNQRMENVDLSNIKLQKEYSNIIKQVFVGESVKASFYSKIHKDIRNVIGVPIRGTNDLVVGALITSSVSHNQKAIIDASLKVILISILVAILISIVIANMFVRSITKPILKVRSTTSELAQGDYTVKTNITRKDEIGDLATTVDVLADKLLDNEKERKNMEQMRLDFFANVSHELRTPITVIRAYTETLYDRIVTDEEKTMQYYQRMLVECKSMERLVGDLLSLSKMQNPDFEVEKEPVSIVQIFEDIIRSAGAISLEKSVTIEVQRDESNCLIYGDYDRLRQMFMVILDNAIKFSKENSKIHIKIAKEDKLKISIKDYGTGISKEELPYIFEKFYRSKLRQNAKGSGLGLAIAKQIALKHGGFIEVESELGRGTSFFFTFDYMKEDDLPWDTE